MPPKSEPKKKNKEGTVSKGNVKNHGNSAPRKSTRFLGKPRVVYSKRGKNKSKSSKNRLGPKPTIKAPYAYSIPMTCDSLCFRGEYYQIGDIVALKDCVDHNLYYAQIRGFLNDQYSEKSAVITWLLPSSSSPEDRFDASTYFLGPEEDIPRKLEYMKFICHAPSDYYRNPYSPYPTSTMKPEVGFIWSRGEYSKSIDSMCKIDECTKVGSQVIKIFAQDKHEDICDDTIDVDSHHNQTETINIAQGDKRADLPNS